MNEQDTLYPIGTEVQIKLDSPYKYQGFKDEIKLKGVVTNCYDKREVVDNHIYNVNWLNGSSNVYRPSDLELWQEEKPVVQELASLPEKWCVKVTKDNRETLIKWRGWGSESITLKGVSGYLNSSKIWNSYIQKKYIEITFDQFKKWVLKEPQQIAQEDTEIKAGDWVVRLVAGNYANAVTKGKVYKCQSVHGNNIILEKDDKNQTNAYTKSNFRKALPHEIVFTDTKNWFNAFEKGKWYKVFTNTWIVFKADAITHDRVCFYNRKYFKNNTEHEADYVEFKHINHVRRLDESEIYQYLPYHAWSVNIAEASQIVPNKVEKQTSVNKITSVDVKLIKPKQTIYF